MLGLLHVSVTFIPFLLLPSSPDLPTFPQSNLHLSPHPITPAFIRINCTYISPATLPPPTPHTPNTLSGSHAGMPIPL
ncbi:hypothetical protein CC78DRAFT_534861 [Lojkania enalia]|uniref:Secreted protein n=1 Tax=Lojkania enalia TaxID=147567 RepID=A0A9P4KAB3_9PLEO|nr:hypothetical protein CC78DRAFT_534861 [Didymosphaeria enalia]